MNQIKHLPAKTGGKQINPAQGSFDLCVDKQTELHGIGMGVLNDGTPFLTQRGLAALCGVENAHIGTISSTWSDEIEKPRISTIKKLLADRGVFVESAHMEVKDGNKTMFAYPDTVCVAILEYYAFEAGTNCKEEAKANFRRLAGKALHDFIYTQVGYDPKNNLPEAWKQFHDRVSLNYDSVPSGYFGIFKEISDIIVTLGQAGLHIDSTFVPDISVGQCWSKHWKDNDYDSKFGERIKYQHNYPSYFPQAWSNPQEPWCYPEEALGEFRRWVREQYIGENKFSTYLNNKVKSNDLPVSFAQLAITAVKEKR